MANHDCLRHKDSTIEDEIIAFYQLKQAYRVVEVLFAQYLGCLDLHLEQLVVEESTEKERSLKLLEEKGILYSN